MGIHFRKIRNLRKILILTKTRLSRLKKWDEEFALKYTSEIRLITYKEMQTLFPHSTIWKEKIFIFSKSFVAHNL